MKIEVTKRDIQKGRRRNADDCPVAMAMKRVFRRPVLVGTTIYSIKRNGEWSEGLKLPERAGRFVRAFDACEEVRPFSFIIRNPLKKARR